MRFLTKKQKVLLALIREFSRKNMSSKLGIEKGLFILKQEENMQDFVKFYSFLPYKLGPYSYVSYRDISQLKLQPFVTVYLPDSWYLESKPVITLDFKKHTSSVPLNLVIGRVVGGRWNVYLEGTAYPGWTSRPPHNYTITINAGYVIESPLQRR